VPNEWLAWDARELVCTLTTWLIIPTPNGCCVLTEETQRGFVARLFKVFTPNLMSNSNQKWLEALAVRFSNANTKLSSHPQPAVSTKDVLPSKMRKVKMLNVGSKVIAITGASSGIGEATARSHKGLRVVLGARRTDRLEAIASEIRSEGGVAEYRALDVISLEEMQAFVSLQRSVWSP